MGACLACTGCAGPLDLAASRQFKFILKSCNKSVDNGVSGGQ